MLVSTYGWNWIVARVRYLADSSIYIKHYQSGLKVEPIINIDLPV